MAHEFDRGADRSRSGGAVTSRRTLLRVAGATAALGLPAGAGHASASADTTYRIVASPAQAELARTALERVRERLADTALSLSVAPTGEAVPGLADGPVDALVGSRPLLPGERRRVIAEGHTLTRREYPAALASVDYPEGVWIECCSPERVARTWGSDVVVETWAEASLAGAGPAVGGTDRRTVRRPGTDGRFLVRGRRSHQYADGHGGLGYYAAEDDWIAADVPTGTESHTTLAKVASLYVAGPGGENRDSRVGRALRRAVGQVSQRRVGELAVAASPVETSRSAEAAD